MQLESLAYTAKAGWSIQPFPALDSDRTLVIVFGAVGYARDTAPLRELRDAYPRARIVGCSTSGEIHGEELADETLSVAIARFDGTDVSRTEVPIDSPEDSFAAGTTLATQLTRDDLKAILVLSDGLNVNGSELVAGINSTLDEAVVVTGGLAGDGDRFEETWVLSNGQARSRTVTAVGLYGDRVQVQHGSRGGWTIFGPERTITRADGAVLYELDGGPALELYKEYLGDLADNLPASGLRFPLALRASSGDEKHLVRTILSVDEEQQTITFAGDMPVGHKAQLMRTSHEMLVEGATNAALRASSDDGAAATLAIAISCVGRRLILGERTEDELEAVLDKLPAGAHQIGFYSYGEIAPYSTGRPDLHNQTMTLTTISEA